MTPRRRPHRKPRPRPPTGGRQSKEPLVSTPTDWGGVAEWYDQLVGAEGSEFHQAVVHPGVLRLIAPAPGDPVLDVACGQGALCRLLAARGAVVTGVDAAQPLIDAARAHAPPQGALPNHPPQATGSARPSLPQATGGSAGSAAGAGNIASPTYLVGDARDLSFLPASRFAAVACVLAIQNIHPIAPVFRGVARALRPDGRFVLVMMHPAFRAPGQTHWGWDDTRRVQYRRVDGYLLPRKVPIVAHPGKKTGEYTWTFHKPLGEYVRALRNAGLLVDALEEWPSHKTSQPGPRAAAENTARKEIPMFLALRAVRGGISG